MYKFSAERQFIFNVSVRGQVRLVQFGEAHVQNGTTVFMTSDAGVADAIRKTQIFKRGAIKEVESLSPDPSPIWEGKADANEVNEPNGGNKTSGMEVKEFANFSQAKEYLSRTFGVEKKLLRNRDAVANFAKEKGLEIVYATDN